MNSLSVTSGGGQGKTTTLGQTEAKMEAMDNTLDSLTASVTQMENDGVKLQTSIVKLMGVKGRLFWRMAQTQGILNSKFFFTILFPNTKFRKF